MANQDAQSEIHRQRRVGETTHVLYNRDTNVRGDIM